MTARSESLAALKRVEDAQAALRSALRDIPPARLRKRPPSGEWSPMEHVRHLVFAEQHHFSVLLPKGFRWSSAGVPPPNRTGERRLSPVGKEPGTTIDEVFDAWTKVNDVVRDLIKESSHDRWSLWLDGNLKHVRLHARTIDTLLGITPPTVPGDVR